MKRRNALILSLAPAALLASFFLLSPAARPQDAARPALDDAAVLEILQKHQVPGASVAVIRDFDVLWAKGYGVADVETQAPVQANTLFQAASISKPVTAMAVLSAVQEGRFSLDDDINKLLKSWKASQEGVNGAPPVTLRALLSHTSGSWDGFGFPGYHPDADRPTLVQILRGEKPSNVGPVSFERPPFTVFKYSGGGTTIVQLALMDVLDQPFHEILRQRVLEPLRMNDSTYEQPLPDSRAQQAARAHGQDGKRKDAPWHVYPEQAAAGLWTTARDLARFAVEVQTALRGPQGRVLSQALVREMVRPVGVGPFAVGLSINKRGEGWYFSHGGSNWGFRCDMMAHTLKGYGAVIMTNGDNGGGAVRAIGELVSAAYNWDSLDKPVPRQ